MSSKYAQNTNVGTIQSIGEIKKCLNRYDADSFMYAEDRHHAQIMFRIRGRMYRINIPMPQPSDESFTETPTGRERSENQARQLCEQEVKRRWRSLALVVKAKLEAVASGIATVEQEFLAYTVLPEGQTVGEWIEPQIVTAYVSGEMPKMLMSGKEENERA